MKSFTSAMFVSGAVAALAPYPYPAASSPAVYYPTGAAPTYPVANAPYPYASNSAIYQTTCSTEPGYYTTYYATQTAATYYATPTAPVYVTQTYEYENQMPTDVYTKTIVYTTDYQTVTSTVVVVIPTYGASTETVVIVQPTAPVYSAPVYTTATEDVTVTAPYATVCTPAADVTVTQTEKVYITVTAPVVNKPTPYASTVVVTPVKPSAPAVYQPVAPSYAPASNATTTQVVKPTYSAPVQYTGSAAKSAAGFGGLAIAALAFFL